MIKEHPRVRLTKRQEKWRGLNHTKIIGFLHGKLMRTISPVKQAGMPYPKYSGYELREMRAHNGVGRPPLNKKQWSC